jgi:acyl-CoA dehydrogenase-like protein
LDFQLNEEQLQLKKSVREFAGREIKPNVMKWDEAGEFPMATIKELGKLGFLGMIFPPEYGGAGMGYVEYVTAIEELSRVDGSVGIIVAAHTSLCSNHIFLAGNEAQKKKYVSKLATGESIGAWGLTEPSSGSDAGSARMTAARKGNSWVLNGTKTFCTNGHYADVVVVLAVTDRAAHTHGISAFVVEKGTKGFRPGKKENKLGLRASDTAELIFEDCTIPAENLLGGEGQGFPDAMRVLDGGRISIAALSLGMAEGSHVFEAAPTIRQGHQRFPGNSVETGRHGDRNRRGHATHHARRLHERRGHEDHAGVVHGQALCQRSSRQMRQRRRTDSWRLRLHQRLPRRKVLPRREALHHRRGYQRNSAVGDRAAVAEGLDPAMALSSQPNRPHE